MAAFTLVEVSVAIGLVVIGLTVTLVVYNGYRGWGQTSADAMDLQQLNQAVEVVRWENPKNPALVGVNDTAHHTAVLAAIAASKNTTLKNYVLDPSTLTSQGSGDSFRFTNYKSGSALVAAPSSGNTTTGGGNGADTFNASDVILNARTITAFTGGGLAALDGITTAGLPSGRKLIMGFAGQQYLFELADSSATTSTPNVIRPADYNGSTNVRAWLLRRNYDTMAGSNNLSEITDASAARTKLGLKTMSVQDSTNVSITGGAVAVNQGAFSVGTMISTTGNITKVDGGLTGGGDSAFWVLPGVSTVGSGIKLVGPAGGTDFLLRSTGASSALGAGYFSLYDVNNAADRIIVSPAGGVTIPGAFDAGSISIGGAPLDMTYVKKSGDTMTGALNAPSLSATTALTVGTNASTGSKIILNGLGTAGNVPYISLRSAGTQFGVIGLSGAFLGTNATDVGILAEAGKKIQFMPNGSATAVGEFTGSGMNVNGLMSATIAGPGDILTLTNTGNNITGYIRTGTGAFGIFTGAGGTGSGVYFNSTNALVQVAGAVIGTFASSGLGLTGSLTAAVGSGDAGVFTGGLLIKRTANPIRTLGISMEGGNADYNITDGSTGFAHNFKINGANVFSVAAGGANVTGPLGVSGNLSSAGAYSNTTTSDPNVYIDAAGMLHRSTATLGGGSFVSKTGDTMSGALVVNSTITASGAITANGGFFGPFGSFSADSGGQALRIYGRASDNYAWAPLVYTSTGAAYQGGMSWDAGGARVYVGNSLAQVASFTSTGISLPDDKYTRYGPNSSWGAFLRVGGNGRTSTTDASVATTNGNLHLDSANGNAIYLNYYSNGPIYATSGANTVLHSGNFNSYTPTLTGTGASGTWPISVNGNAGSSSTLQNGATLPTTVYLSGGNPYRIAGNQIFVDTLDSGVDSDWLELVYSSGQGVRVGSGANGSKPLYASNLFAGGRQVLRDGIARGSYGSFSAPDSANGWSGIDFTSASSTFMVRNGDGYSGIYQEGGAGWKWGFDGSGSLIAGSVPWGMISGRPTAIAGTWNWSGQSGQPSWLWGSNDGTNMYVWNPSNFSVNYASRSGRANGYFYIDDNYGNGVVGVYASTRYQGVYAMGDAYKLPADGTSPGNLYGLAWTHENVGGQSRPGLSHQLLVMENGVTKVALGSGIWTAYNVTANQFNGSGAGLTGTASSLNIGGTAGYARYVYNNGAYSGSGWTEPSDLGVRYANSAGTATNVTNLSGTWDSISYFRSNKGGGSYVGGQNSYALEAYSSDGGAAAMSFHRGGYYAVNFGLDPDNVMRIGGWSAGSNLWQLDMSGNNTIAGTSQANSFRSTSTGRFKENIKPISGAMDVINRLQGVYYDGKPGTKLEGQKHEPGFIAEAVGVVIPEIVGHDDKGKIDSVDYSRLTPFLVEAMKASARKQDITTSDIDALKQEVVALKTQVAERHGVTNLAIILALLTTLAAGATGGALWKSSKTTARAL